MTAQEVFDKVVNHLRTQGKRAIDAEGYCVYRAPDGCKCAAGCLIPDADYKPEYEKHTVWNIEHVFERLGLSEHMRLIAGLQGIHDREAFFVRKEHYFEQLAYKHGLEYKEPVA